MTAHDSLCPTPYRQLTTCRYCDLIARVRADERERWGLGWIATANLVSAMTAAERRAEAVDARLVEVIVENAQIEAMLKGAVDVIDRERDDLRAERDRLRAEVADLSARLNGGSIR